MAEYNVKFFSEQVVAEAEKFKNYSESDAKIHASELEDFKKTLKASYVALDDDAKSSQKNNLLEIKKTYKEEVAIIIAEKEEKLKAETDRYAKVNKTKAEETEHGNIVTGIETVAKRAKIKAKRDYYEAIKNEKLKRFDIHTEYVSILNYAGFKASFYDKMRSQNLENQATTNFAQIVTSKTTWFNLVPLFMLIVMIAAYAIGKSITSYNGNLGDVINNGIFVAVVATGAVYIYSQGGFDMSLGSAALTCAAVAAYTWNGTHNIFLTIVLAVILGALLGIVNAILATMLGLPVMVMTLTMMNILTAINEQILGSVMKPDVGLPREPWVYASILFLFFLLCWFIFNYTKVGRRNKFIGSNKIAARFNGINLMKAGIISFAISGIGLGLCGFIFTASKSGGQFTTNTVLSQVGLNVVVAIVFGGMTTSGGPKSKISCAIIGAFFCVFLDEFFAAIQTPTFQVSDYCYMVKGIVFIIVSLANMWDTRTKMLASGGSIQ